MKKIIETQSLVYIAEQMQIIVGILDLLDEDDVDEISYFAGQIRELADEIREIVDMSDPAPADKEGGA